jgi:hypothetical protein
VEPLRILPSNPDYVNINHLSHLLAVAVNPQAHFDTHKQDMSELDQIMVYQHIYDALQLALDDAKPSASISTFDDFVEVL